MSNQTAKILHHVPGRLRVAMPGVRRDPEQARTLRTALERLEGVHDVRVSTLTGSVVVQYTRAVTDVARIAGVLNTHVPAANGATAIAPRASALTDTLTDAFVDAAVQALAKRCAIAVVAALV